MSEKLVSMTEKMHEAMFWHKESLAKIAGIRCELCARRCFIPEGKRGFCLVRENKGNKLFSLNYGKVVALNTDPIEKKPLFHFYPGSFALSYACAGCNWRCKYCCNWEISQNVDPEKWGTNYLSEQIVEMAEKAGLNIISHTYTEPTVFFEFAFDIAKLANRKKMKNTFVTNGYITEEPLKKISKFLDAATVDFKASGDEKFLNDFASVPSAEPIFQTLKLMKKLGIHIEITDLIIPKIGDDVKKFRELVKWVVDNLGPDTPFHILRFFPSYKMSEFPDTPLETLEKFAAESKKMGMKYVYVGNVPGHKYENTYCSNCNELLVERIGFNVVLNLKKNKCPKCGKEINVVLD